MDKNKIIEMIFNILGHSIFIVISLFFWGMINILGHVVYGGRIELLNSLELVYYDEIEKIVKVRNFDRFLPEGGLKKIVTFEITNFPWNGMVFIFLFF